MEKPESPDELKNLLISLLKSGKTRIEIADSFNVNKKTISEWLKKFDIKLKDYREFQLPYNIHVFDKIDTEEKAYWLGFLYADGCVSYRMNTNSYDVKLELAGVDIEHVKKFKTLFQDTRNNEMIKAHKRIYKGKELYYCRYRICNEHLAKSLIALGCTIKKSLTLTFPDIKIFSNPDLVFDFIRGYIDGDGSLTYQPRKNGIKNPRISIIGTREFLEGVIKYLPQFSGIRKHNKEEKIFQIYAYGKKAREIANKLYGHATIYLDRKYEKFKALFEYKDGKDNKDGE